MGILLCEQNFLDVWIRNKSVRAEICHILRTHTHTHAAKLVVAGVDLGGIPLSRAPQISRRDTRFAGTVIRPGYQFLPRFGDLILFRPGIIIIDQHV